MLADNYRLLNYLNFLGTNEEEANSGSLDPSIHSWLGEAGLMLVDRADPKVLAQVLVDLKLLSKEDARKTLVSTLLFCCKSNSNL